MSNGTKTRITIKAHNKLAYMSMMRDMLAKKNGIYSFVLRCDSGRIVDYVFMENTKIK
jgi:hypothetical protein